MGEILAVFCPLTLPDDAMCLRPLLTHFDRSSKWSG